jgi:hypothetical protein
MSTPRTAVPDLLKRFVPTRYKLIARGTVVETNDIDLLEQFDIGRGTERLSAMAPEYRIRVVRDTSATAGSDDARVMCTEQVCLLTVGTGTIIMVDREQKCVFTFLARNVTNRQFANIYLPMAMEHARSNHVHPVESIQS